MKQLNEMTYEELRVEGNLALDRFKEVLDAMEALKEQEQEMFVRAVGR